MSFDYEKANGLLTEWLDRQRSAFRSFPPVSDQSGDAGQAAELWRSYMLWLTLARILPAQSDAIEDSTDPLVAPTVGGLEGLVGRANEGPSFATLWDADRKSMRSYGAWLEMRNASAAHRGLLDKSWQEAHRRFLVELAKTEADGGPLIDSWRKGLDHWLAIANQCLMETQRTDEFLQTQKRLLRSAMDYRLSLRELAEEFCEIHQIPGRGELDDLSRTVHDLRRELRALKRRDPATPVTGQGREVVAC